MTPGSVDVSVVDSDEDGFLYHYTSLEALIGIVNHRTLWASNIKYLNDTSEQTILQNLVRDQILELIAKQSSNAPGRWRQAFQRALDIFVVCLSEDAGDRLSQWRAYGGTCGVCLKFHKRSFVDYFDRGYPGSTFQKVKYVSPDWDAHLRAWAEKIKANLDSDEPGNPPHRIAIESAFFKHQSFREEKEWRTIAIRLGAPLRHRVRGSLLIPYIELNLGEVLPNLLEAVIVGPMNHKEQTAEAIEGLLKENGLSAVKVWCSKTPYRGF